MFHARTSASRLVSSIAVMIHSLVSCLYPARMFEVVDREGSQMPCTISRQSVKGTIKWG